MIPNGVTIIEPETFYDCRSLTDIFIPVTIKTISYAAFDSCSAVNNIYYTGSESEWTSVSVYANNSVLYTATIHYNFILPGTISWTPTATETPITGTAAETLLERINEGKSIPLTLTEETAPTATKMLAAIYDENERFLGMDMVDVVYTDGVFTTPISFTNYSSAASMKLLLVDGSYAPVVQNLTVEP